MNPGTKHKCLFLLVIIAASLLVFCATAVVYTKATGPFPLPLWLVNKQAPWDSIKTEYNGPGKLLCYTNNQGVANTTRQSIEYRPRLYSAILKKHRELAVYTPPHFDAQRKAPYPVIYYLHGYVAPKQMWIDIIVSELDRAIQSSAMPPVVMVRHDASISGDGSADPENGYDKRAGSWYINSNAGRFEDHFFEEIVPFIQSNFNVSKDPESVALFGTSMGGFGALYYSLRHSEFSNIVVPFYPCVDLRFCVNGNRLSEYDPARYRPIATDSPTRIINGSYLFGTLGLTEEFLYYAVFNSDAQKGQVWKDNRPVWERMRDSNPADMLRSRHYRLNNHRFFIIAGDRDDYNTDDQIKVVIPMLRKYGARVFPENNIISGGRHDFKFQTDNMGSVLEWIGHELRN